MFNYMRKLLFGKENTGESSREMEDNSESTQRDIKQITEEIKKLDSDFKVQSYNYSTKRSKLKYDLSKALFSNTNKLITKPKEYLFSDGVFDNLNNMVLFINVRNQGGLFRFRGKFELANEKCIKFKRFVGNRDLIGFGEDKLEEIHLYENEIDDFLSIEDKFIVEELYIGWKNNCFKECDLVWVNTRDY